MSQGEIAESVPQTDTGRLVEYTKASGRTIAKELGKLAGRNFGRCPAREARKSGVGRSERLLTDCLTKTQVSAKPKGKV